MVGPSCGLKQHDSRTYIKVTFETNETMKSFCTETLWKIKKEEVLWPPVSERGRVSSAVSSAGVTDEADWRRLILIGWQGEAAVHKPLPKLNSSLPPHLFSWSCHWSVVSLSWSVYMFGFGLLTGHLFSRWRTEQNSSLLSCLFGIKNKSKWCRDCWRKLL